MALPLPVRRRRSPARPGNSRAPPRQPGAYPDVLMPADQGHDEGFFGERVASVYDEHAAAMFDPAVVTPVVDLLAGLAGRGAALELGVGTGRVAPPPTSGAGGGSWSRPACPTSRTSRSARPSSPSAPIPAGWASTSTTSSRNGSAPSTTTSSTAGSR